MTDLERLQHDFDMLNLGASAVMAERDRYRTALERIVATPRVSRPGEGGYWIHESAWRIAKDALHTPAAPKAEEG